MNDTMPFDPMQTTAAPTPQTVVGNLTGRVSRLFGHTLTLQATSRFLRRQLWAWPIIAAVLLAAVGWWVSSAVEEAMRENRIAALTTILEADVAALRIWMADQKSDAEVIARDERLRPIVQELLALAGAKSDPGRELLVAPAQTAIRARLKDPIRIEEFVGFFVVSPAGVVLASDQDPPVGRALIDFRKAFFDNVVGGRVMISHPFRSSLLLADEHGKLRADLPSMFVAAPIRDESGKPLAALGLRIRPEDEFTRILQVASSGKSGETYAFDRNGLFLSQSRFDDDLKQFGLLADQPGVRSILTLELRDPQVNMAAGERPKLRRADQPLTRMASAAVKGEDGHDVDGYRDYRGVPTIGAWKWLDEFDFGVATEVDVAEAFRPLYILRRAFWVMLGLLAMASVGIFVAMLYMARQQCCLQKATLAAKQLGQYTLEEKLGAGGMGTVYKARHAMLRRPTAVKLLNVDKISDAAIARFEREVQLTSTLTHPNTIAVYDYGRTADGIFYYAMEYLEGINLDDLVTRFGPLSEARLVYLLRQACGSLAEAHAAGLIHRDIKPANIILTNRGGLHDFVKVLDFGLAKAREGPESAQLTADNAAAGTPLYMSPEAIQRPDMVDARTDIYALGAVGYYLLTGSPVFSGDTVMDICMKHLQTPPEPPSRRFGINVSAGLETLLMRCLAKSPSDRPADAAAMLRELNACPISGRWTEADAAQWWSDHAVDSNARAESPANSAMRRSTPMPVGVITMDYQDD